MHSKLRLVVASVIAFAALGVGSAVAAPGGSSDKVPCVVTAPGFPDATGTGRVVTTPSGRTMITCNAKLPEGASAPDEPVKIEGGGCTTTITPGGQVNAQCKP
jgi:hypothetical protein